MSALKVGDRGVDYSYARPAPADIVKAGATFVIRYSAGAASATSHPSHAANAGKLITPAEFKALIGAGLDVIANDEWYTTRVTEGAAAGTQDGAAAMALWRSCGLAKGATIYVSWDAAPMFGSWVHVDAYLLAYQSALAGYYRVGCYGGTPYLKHMPPAWPGWRPNAGSWSGDGLPYQPDTSSPTLRAALVTAALPKTPAHLWQTGNYWFGKGADENLILRLPVGSHREAQAMTQPAASSGTPYYGAPSGVAKGLVSNNRAFALWFLDDGRLEIRKNGAHFAFLAMQTPPPVTP